jgi:putative addiction module component (TIGR02574 family)
MDDTRRVFSLALDLPQHERAELAARLLESLDGPDEDGEEAWAQEIERRCRALDNGEASTSSREEFRARIERDIFGR